MSENNFIPKTQRAAVSADTAAALSGSDSLNKRLSLLTQGIAIVLFGLLPIFFFSSFSLLHNFDKVLLASTLAAVIAVVLCLLALRKASVKTIVPKVVLVYGLFVAFSFLSSVVSGDIQDSLVGSYFEVHTTGFLLLVLIVMMIPLVFQNAKGMIAKALTVFGISAFLLQLYVLSRFIFGAEFLSFGSLSSVTETPIGSFNDLAIFSGLLILMCMVTLVQLPLRAVQRTILTLLIAVSVGHLVIVNFLNVWAVVGFVSLLTFIYLAVRGHLLSQKSTTQPATGMNGWAIVVSAVVCICAILFTVAGQPLGQQVAETTGISYVEVRPSLVATTNIVSEVYANDSIVFGVGPNRFGDAWRQYKDSALNETVFWNTTFGTGYGFVPTVFVTTGLLGGLLLVLFHLYLLFIGYRMLVKTNSADRFWYYIGAVSFTATAFLWFMSYMYVPGAALMLVTAFVTGLTLVSYAALQPDSVKEIPLASNERRGFILITVALIVLGLAALSLYSLYTQHSAQTLYSESITLTGEEFEDGAQRAFSMFADDRFVVGQVDYYLQIMNTILNQDGEPSPEEQAEFQRIAREALLLAEDVVEFDRTNPALYAISSRVYSTLAVIGVQGAIESAENSLTKAIALDPQNPEYALQSSQLAVQLGDFTAARTQIEKALDLRRNYTEALFLLAQIDITEGDAAAAIETVSSIITLEPDNPTRYFQLGVLYSAEENIVEAQAAFEAAIAIDADYANARYLLALSYLEEDRVDEALTQLRIVERSNRDNGNLQTLIKQLEFGEPFEQPDLGFETPVTEIVPTNSSDTVTTQSGSDTGLIAPINQVTVDELSGSNDVEETTEATDE